MGSTRQGPPTWGRVLWDSVSLIGAWVIVFKQAGIIFDPPSSVNEPLLWFAGALIGVPGATQILSMRFGGGVGGGPRMGSSPPVPQRRRRSGGRSASSSRLGGDDGDAG